MCYKIALLLTCTLLSLRAFSQHTFSICAVDTATGEVGSAGASCINNSVIISDVHPGVGVIHTQASYIPINQQVGRNLMNAGLTPQQIIDSLVAGDFVLGAPNRQYGVVKMHNGSPLVAGYTGTNCIDYKNHITGPYYSIQGNILISQEVLDSMEARFLSTEGDLACRLMAAMQGANMAGADTRCLGINTSSLSSFLRVALPGDDPDTPTINIIIDSGPTGYEPIDSLQTRFDQVKNCGEDTTGTGIIDEPSNKFKVIFHRHERTISVSTTATGKFLFELFDSTGKNLLNKNFEGPKLGAIISVSKYPRGIYHWRISENEKTTSGKLFVE